MLGASSRPGALSGRFMGGLLRHGFTGRVVPVNPKRTEIDGLPCAASVAEAAEDGPIDLAVVSLPRPAVLGALEECAAAGVAGAVVFASGFSEVGEAGAAEERRLTEVAHRTGIERVVQAGAQPVTWVALAVELQRDWARVATVADVIEIVLTERLLKE